MTSWIKRILLATLALAGVSALLLYSQLNRPFMNAVLGYLPASFMEVFSSLRPAGIGRAENLSEIFSVPDGYGVNLYAGDLGPVRILHFTDRGDLLASVPHRGQVLLIERNGQTAGGVRTLLEGLNRPHGLEIIDEWLYIGEADAIARVRFNAHRGAVEGPVERILTGLPGDGNHWTKTVRQGPDGWLYFNVGSSCNVCLDEAPKRATLMRVRPDGSGAEIYATGLRNTVGWDWQPNSGVIYGVDNGRDWLGDDFPPCELNRIERHGFYGWPFYNGDNVPDPEFRNYGEKPQQIATPPALALPAHSAPLSIHFLTPPYPPGLQNAALVTLHGSWNRSEKSGYALISLHWNADGSIDQKPFWSGFIRDGRVLGRPVDVVLGPDRAFYVSDDYGQAVYRLSFTGL